MPAQDGTLTPEDVAEELGVPVDDRVVTSTDAARAWAEKRRDATVRATSSTQLWSQPDVHRGGVLYAAVDYQSRTTPQGLAGFDPETAPTELRDAYWRALDLVGLDPVIA